MRLHRHRRPGHRSRSSPTRKPSLGASRPRSRTDRRVALGEITGGTAPGRTSLDQITACDLTGTGVRGTAIALLAYRKATARGFGITIENRWARLALALLRRDAPEPRRPCSARTPVNLSFALLLRDGRRCPGEARPFAIFGLWPPTCHPRA